MNPRLLPVLALLLASGHSLPAQDPSSDRPATPIEPAEPAGSPVGEVDPFSDDGLALQRQLDPGRAARNTASVLVRLESFDVPTASALDLLDEWTVKEGGDALRAGVMALVRNEEAAVEDLLAVTVEVGSKATFEAITEVIYPTEYEMPGLGGPEPKPAPETPLEVLIQRIHDHLLPTAFETRNTGKTVELEVGLVTVGEGLWDLRLAPELVEFVGMRTYGPEGAESEMPQFNSGRTSSSLRVRDDTWTLVSMQTPYRGDQRETATKRMVFAKVQAAR